MISQQQITDFLANDQIAIAGVSRNKKKFGYTVFNLLRQKGLNLVPINPHADEIDGVATVKSVRDLPETIKALYVVTGKANTPMVVQEAKEKDIKHIWIQQSSDTPDALQALADSNINVISKECILMHHQPHSIHKFHRGIWKFFGKMPK